MAGPIYEYLIQQLKELDESCGEEEKKETQEYDTFVRSLARSFEGFSEKQNAILGKAFLETPNNFLKNQLEDFYLRDMLKKIPRIAARTIKISQMVPRKAPSDALNLYLREATRSYIFGFWQASVALSRAALEVGVREAVNEKLPQPADKLNELIKSAYRLRLLDRPYSELAGRVASTGNRVLHGKPVNEREAWDTLCAARGVLSWLCGGAEPSEPKLNGAR